MQRTGRNDAVHSLTRVRVAKHDRSRSPGHRVASKPSEQHIGADSSDQPVGAIAATEQVARLQPVKHIPVQVGHRAQQLTRGRVAVQSLYK